MVNCRSCGRNIASGTIRCTNCSSPFHLSCSHRYNISQEGVFDICCGPNSYNQQNTGYQTRSARRNNKRRGGAQNQGKPTTAEFIGGQQNSDNNSMRFAKIQKIETMGFADNPVQDHCEIVQEDIDNQEVLNINDNEVEILDDSIEVEEIQGNSTMLSFKRNTNSEITLETVWKGISSLQNSITNISTSLDTVSSHLNTFDPRINELESTLNVIKNKTSNFENVTNDVSGLRSDLERISHELEDIKSKQNETKVPDISEIFSEIRERDFKSRNIIIYNVPEDNLRISQDYSTVEDINKFNALVAARDNSRAREILEDIPNVNLQNMYTRRIGRMNPNICRPLRVILQSKEDVIHIMKNRNMISQPYNVRTDLTKFQQNKIKQLKQELEQINVDKNNPTMTIKFVNGEPKIVPILKRE